jgi:hypothetical protein
MYVCLCDVFLLHSVCSVSFCQYADRISPKLPAANRRLSGLGIDFRSDCSSSLTALPCYRYICFSVCARAKYGTVKCQVTLSLHCRRDILNSTLYEGPNSASVWEFWPSVRFLKFYWCPVCDIPDNLGPQV